METISKISFWLLTIGLFLCNWTNGFCDSIRSVTYSMMKDEVPLSYSQYGGLQSLGLFSYVIWAFAAASVLDSMGYKLTFVISIIASIVGNLLTITSKNYLLILGSQFFATSLLGVLDDCPTSLAVIVFTKHSGALFCIMSGIYGLGAFVGPLWAKWIMDTFPKYTSRGIYVSMNIPILLVLLFLAFIPFAINHPRKKEDAQKEHMSVWQCVKSPMIWYCGLMLIMMTTAERSTLFWGSVYVKEVLHLTEDDGALLNSRFYFCFMVARFLGGFVTDWLGPFLMEYIIIPAGIVVYVIGFAMGAKGVYVLPLVGIFVSLYFPTFIVSTSRYWGDDCAIPVACILPIQCGIGALIQSALGVINERYGPQYAYWAAVPCAAIALLMFIFYHVMAIRREKERESLLNKEQIAVCPVCWRKHAQLTAAKRLLLVKVLDVDDSGSVSTLYT